MNSQIQPGAASISADLRSDTVTRPTPAMYEAMRSAALGDDGLEGDPTVRRLEALVATRLGKEAGLFVPSATMGNLLATLAQAGRQEQVILEAASHMYTSERGAATFTGLFYLGVRGEAGAMDLNVLEEAIRPASGRLKTALLCMETSHNNAGGAVLSLEHMERVFGMAQHRGIRVHLDGARLFNAAVALKAPVGLLAQYADTVSLCLSKGLSAPVGAVLSGPRSTMENARRLRKMLGGTQRQAGIMAAAGIEGVQAMGERLADDHVRAGRLSVALNDLHGNLSASVPDTNIVLVDVSRSGHDSTVWADELGKTGVLVRAWGADRIRCVTHRHIDDAALKLAIDAFRRVAEQLMAVGDSALPGASTGS